MLMLLPHAPSLRAFTTNVFTGVTGVRSTRVRVALAADVPTTRVT